jgi:hypothetical protein
MSRPRVEWRSASAENYKSFCNKHPEENISSDDWAKIIYAFNQMIIEHVLETGEKVKLPLGIGDFSINKKKRKQFKLSRGEYKINLPVDWKKSKEKGKVIYNFNYHTEGYYFGWQWFRKTARFKNSDLFYFKASRAASRLLAHYIKVDEKYQHIYAEWRK